MRCVSRWGSRQSWSRSCLACGGIINTRAQLQTAHELGDTLLRLAHRVQDPALAAVAHYALGLTSFWLGAFPAARLHLEAGIARYTPEQRRAPAFRMGQDPGVACPIYAAVTLWTLGYPAQALARVHEALALAHELAHPFSLAFARCFAAFVAQFRRDVPAVHAHAEATVTLATEQGFPQWAVQGTILQRWALALQGQGEEEIAQVRQGIAAYRATGAAVFVPYFYTWLADVAAHLGQVEEGLQALAEASTLVGSGSPSPLGRRAPAAAGDAAGGGGSLVAASPRRRPPPGGEIAGATGGHEPGTLVAAAGQAGRGARAPGTGLWLVHGGL